MKENVGRADRIMRSVVGPALMWVGYSLLESRRRRGLGLVALAAGSMIAQTAVTRTCPINALLGRDTIRRGKPAGEKAGEEAA